MGYFLPFFCYLISSCNFYYYTLPPMFVDFVLVLMLFFLSIPTITAYFAYSYGLSFWKWFMIGCCLPLFANILLICRVKNYEKIRKWDPKLTRYEDEYMNKLIGESFSESDSLSKNRKEY